MDPHLVECVVMIGGRKREGGRESKEERKRESVCVCVC